MSKACKIPEPHHPFDPRGCECVWTEAPSLPDRRLPIGVLADAEVKPLVYDHGAPSKEFTHCNVYKAVAGPDGQEEYRLERTFRIPDATKVHETPPPPGIYLGEKRLSNQEYLRSQGIEPMTEAQREARNSAVNRILMGAADRYFDAVRDVYIRQIYARLEPHGA